MSKVRFKLRAARTLTVRSLNDKLYELKTGINILELEYDEYVALLGALNITPRVKRNDDTGELYTSSLNTNDSTDSITSNTVDNTDHDEDNSADSPSTSDKDSLDKSESEELENKSVDSSINSLDVNTQESDSDSASDNAINDKVDNIDEDVNSNNHNVDNTNKTSSVDYASMTYAQLKDEYKKITGKGCRLKRDDLIKFLQER